MSSSLRLAPVVEGEALLSTFTSAKLNAGHLYMDPGRHVCSWKGKPVTLTITEFLILQALASRPGVVKSRRALIDAAYNDQGYIGEQPIDSHIKRLRNK